jgi:hypothetical protein
MNCGTHPILISSVSNVESDPCTVQACAQDGSASNWSSRLEPSPGYFLKPRSQKMPCSLATTGISKELYCTEIGPTVAEKKFIHAPLKRASAVKVTFQCSVWGQPSLCCLFIAVLCSLALALSLPPHPHTTMGTVLWPHFRGESCRLPFNPQLLTFDV